MLTITVDCNSDVLTLSRDNKEIKSVSLKKLGPYTMAQHINLILNEFDMGQEGEGINLEVIDEDNRKTLGEW